MKCVCMILSFLILLNVAGAELSHLEMRVANDSRLQEDYDYICTSINDVEFSSLPRPGVSLQNFIDNTEDDGIIYISSGYYDLNETLLIDNNITVVGKGLVVADAEKNFEILEIDNPWVTM